MMNQEAALAEQVVEALADQGLTLAVAESLTGGLVCARLTAITGVSAVFRGGLVVYSSELKTQLLAVPENLIREHGAPSAQVAQAMVEGTRDRLQADVSLALTGVAGPKEQHGWPVGAVHIALSGPDRQVQVRRFDFVGDRGQIRAAAVIAGLELVLQATQVRE